MQRIGHSGHCLQAFGHERYPRSTYVVLRIWLQWVDILLDFTVTYHAFDS